MPNTSAVKPARADRHRLKKRGYHHGDLKAAIVEAALKLIAKRGPRGFALSEAAKLAGVSVGAPYRHFADKEALFSAIAAQGFLELSDRLETARITNAENPRERLVAIGTTYVRFAVDRPSHFQVMFDAAIHRRKDAAVDVPADQAFRILTAAVHEAFGNKDAQAEEVLTAAIWAMMHGHAIFAIDDAFTNMAFKTSPEILVRDSFGLLAEDAAKLGY